MNSTHRVVILYPTVSLVELYEENCRRRKEKKEPSSIFFFFFFGLGLIDSVSMNLGECLLSRFESHYSLMARVLYQVRCVVSIVHNLEEKEELMCCDIQIFFLCNRHSTVKPQRRVFLTTLNCTRLMTTTTSDTIPI